MRKENPFLMELEVGVVVKGGKSNPYFIERDEKVTLYMDGLFAVSGQLSSCGIYLLNWVFYALKRDSDVVYIDRGLFLEWSRLSVASYYKGRGELIDNGVIAPYRGGEFWINPALLFRGSRIRYGNMKRLLKNYNND